MHNQRILTSESVSHGHPDKVADQISDALLDECIDRCSYARVAIEALVKSDHVIVAGEVHGVTLEDSVIEKIVRNVIRDIGYVDGVFNYRDVKVITHINQQSDEIAIGVSEKEGAGDQGIMFGYATDETTTYMPATLYYSHKILQNIFSAMKQGNLPDVFGPDGKAQVSMLYSNNIPIKTTNVVLSIQHKQHISNASIVQQLTPIIIDTLPKGFFCGTENLFVNPAGSFVVGGPVSDTGLTGRKVIVDTYGCAVQHGGGAFSGKDATKVDRSAAYMARYIAKNIVAAQLAKHCTVQIAYAIGMPVPISFYVNTHRTGIYNDYVLERFILDNFDLRPGSIIKFLKLKRPIYLNTASYGHFGKTPDVELGTYTWEELNSVPLLSSITNQHINDIEAHN